MRELWAARDGDGELWVFGHSPKWVEGPQRFDAIEFGPGKMPPILFDPTFLPDLKTGEKCRVGLQRVEET